MLAPWRLYLYFTSIIQAQVVTVVVLYLCCKNPWRAPQGKKSEQHFSESTKRHVTSEDEAVTARTHKKDKLEWFFSFPAWGLLCEIVIYVLYPLNATSSTYKLPFFFFFYKELIPSPVMTNHIVNSVASHILNSITWINLIPSPVT